jgi:CRP-like cAMP-binding protein
VPISPDRLRAVPLFSTLSDDELAALAGRFEEREAKAGTRLTTEGASGYTFFVIDSGAVEVARDGSVLTTLGPGDFFGEAAILSGERRNATITSTAETRLWVMFGTEFRILEREWPAIAETIVETMARRAQAAPQSS